MNPILKRIGAALAVIVTLVLVGGNLAWATNTNPNEDHKVTICHRTGSADGGELKNGYNEITVDIASSGYVKGGHTNHEQVGNGPGPDIIPAYKAYAKDGKDWVEFSFPGKGLDYVFADGTTGAEFLANGCSSPVFHDPTGTVTIAPGDCSNPVTAITIVNTTPGDNQPSETFVITRNGKVVKDGTGTVSGQKVTRQYRTPRGAKDVFKVTLTYGESTLDSATATTDRKQCGGGHHRNPDMRATVTGGCGWLKYSVRNVGNTQETTVARVDGKVMEIVTLDPGESYIAPRFTFREDSGRHTLVVRWNGKVIGEKTVGSDCKPTVIKPRATFEGPFGDPWYRARLDNSRSTEPVTFRIHFFSVGKWEWVTRVRTVRAHHVATTRLFHVNGRSLMTITAAGQVIRQQRSAPSGYYGPLPPQ